MKSIPLMALCLFFLCTSSPSAEQPDVQPRSQAGGPVVGSGQTPGTPPQPIPQLEGVNSSLQTVESPKMEIAPNGIGLAPAEKQADPSSQSPFISLLDSNNNSLPPSKGGCLEGENQGHNFWTRSTLTGDWLGLRPRLQESGITFGGNFTQFGFGVNGGVNRRVLPVLRLGDTFEYTGRGEYEVKFDLEKFGGLPKGTLLVRAQNWFGRYGNVTPSTGSFPPAVFAAALPPQPNDPGTPFISDFVLTQPLSKNLVAYIGKKNVLGGADQDEFAGGNGTTQFVNQAFVANPAFLLGLPYSSFTAGVVSPQEWGAIAAFVYDPQDRTKDFFEDGLFAQGVIIGSEVKVKTNFFSLPGHFHVGGIYKRVSLTDLQFNEPPPGVYPQPTVSGFPTLRDSYTIYSGFDQYFHVYSDESKRGWGAFGRASISDGNPTPVQYFLSIGLGGYSPVGYKRGDTFGIGFYYLGASTQFGALPRALFGPRDGYGVELFYNMQITPWMNLTPDFQILKPEAGRIADTSYIGGLRLNLKF